MPQDPARTLRPHHSGPQSAPAASEGGLPALQGNLDAVHPDGTVEAWCWSPDEPGIHREVAVFVDGVEVVRAVCDQTRPDLAAAGVGDGGHALVLVLPLSVVVPGAGARVMLQDVATGRRIGGEVAVTWADAQPGAPVAAPALREMQGNLDRVTRDGWVSGWCWYPEDPDAHVDLTVLVDDEPVGRALAANFRPDLKEHGIGDGSHGFSFALPWSALAEKGTLQVVVRETATGKALGMPILMRAGRLAAAEERIQDLERQIRLLRAQLDEMARHARARDEDRAARELFGTVASFFQALAQGEAVATAPGGGLKGALEDVLARLAPIALAVPAQPVATVCITAGADIDTLHRSLLALREAGVDGAADIVLLDDGAGGGEAALLPALARNLRYLRVPAGERAVAARNELARTARGDLLVFLAPRAHLLPGCLEELAATFAQEPDASVVGARVGREDGLAHHGFVVFGADGLLRDPAWLTSLDDSGCAFLQPAHGVGDVAFALRRADLADAGGFSGAFATDAASVFDLCMRLRARGRKVLYQPLARAAWSGDASADLSPVPDLALQDEDSRRLRERWQAAQGERLFLGHALVIDTAIPRPDRDAGSVATLEQMRVLRRLGWHVAFAAAGGDEAAPAEADRLRREGIEVVAPPRFASATEYLSAEGAALDLVQIHRHMNATLFLDRLRQLAPQAKVVFAPEDLHHLREAREAELSGRPPVAEEQTRAQELDCVQRTDATLVYSEFELDLLRSEVGPDRVRLLRWIAHARPSARGFAERNGICFVGNFRHSPNVDGVQWFVAEIMPLVRRLVPGLRLHVVGADMPDSIRALASSAVEVHGWVPELGEVFDRVRLSVAPLRYGAGFKGKVATSLAHGVPVVGTTVALEGTGLAPGDGVAVADAVQLFAREVVRLHEDEAVWTAAAAAALERCQALYAPEAAMDVFRRLLADFGLPAAMD